MKNNKVIVLLLIAFVMCTYMLCTHYLKFENLDKELPEVKLKNKIEKDKAMAIMISEDGRKYTEYENEKWPGIEYKYNKAECIDSNGQEIGEEVVTFDENTRKATLKTNKTTYCTLYFDNKGTGEEDKPYRIQYIEDLVDLQVAVNNGETYAGKYFSLERDLDFNKESDYRDYQSKEYGDINGNETDEEIKTELTSGSGWKPIGLTQDLAFQGNFDGKNKTLSNIYINADNALSKGLFAYIENATIKNIVLKGQMKVTKIDSGVLAGNVIGTSTIENVKNYVNATSTTGGNSLAGIIGSYSDESGTITIKDCENHGNITNSNNTGGIIGLVNSGTVNIINSKNYGIITNNLGQNVGGLVGRDNGSTSTLNITNCHNYGEIKMEKNNNTSDRRAGGLVGKYSGTIKIEESSNENKITIETITTGNLRAGGLIGQKDSANSLLISNSKNIKDITVNSASNDARVGGLVGASTMLSTINNSYNTAQISVNTTGSAYIGGLAGCLSGNQNVGTYKLINKCYNTGDVKLQAPSEDLFLNAGGLSGYGLELSLLNSYNLGNITITGGKTMKQKGGGVSAEILGSGGVYNSANLGNITSSYFAGGVVGSNNGTNISYNNTYSLGTLSSNADSTNGLFSVGDGTVIVKNSYYRNDYRASNATVSATPMSLTDMKNNTFVNILNNNVNNTKTVMVNNTNYNLCKWQNSTNGPILDLTSC